VALKRQGAQALAVQLAGMSLEQQRQFWEQQTRALRERRQAVRAERIDTETAQHPTTDEISVH
jgi:hypothetical protein